MRGHFCYISYSSPEIDTERPCRNKAMAGHAFACRSQIKAAHPIKAAVDEDVEKLVQFDMEFKSVGMNSSGDEKLRTIEPVSGNPNNRRNRPTAVSWRKDFELSRL